MCKFVSASIFSNKSKYGDGQSVVERKCPRNKCSGNVQQGQRGDRFKLYNVQLFNGDMHFDILMISVMINYSNFHWLNKILSVIKYISPRHIYAIFNYEPKLQGNNCFNLLNNAKILSFSPDS